MDFISAVLLYRNLHPAPAELCISGWHQARFVLNTDHLLSVLLMKEQEQQWE